MREAQWEEREISWVRDSSRANRKHTICVSAELDCNELFQTLSARFMTKICQVVAF